MAKLSVKDLPIQGKKVLVRVDYNVPLDNDLHVIDATRIKETAPTINFILEQGGSVILMSHLGRPEGEVDPELSLAPCAKALEAFLKRPVIMAPNSLGEKTSLVVEKLVPGQVVLLENLRFHRAEEFPDEDPSFAKKLALYGDLYVNDAFAACHRKHSSTYTIAPYFKGKAAAGFLLEKEIQNLNLLLISPQRPFYALIGGAKISSKIGVLKSLLYKIDALFLGGGMAFNFLKVRGVDVGASLVEDSLLSAAEEIIELANNRGIPLILPIDFMVSNVASDEGVISLVDLKKGFNKSDIGLDIGPQTISLFRDKLQDGKTIFWNGPLGVYEFPVFAKGTQAIAKTLGNLKATTCVGGGDLVAAIQDTGVADKITHISTGGGATLEYIEKGTLPGIEALTDR